MKLPVKSKHILGIFYKLLDILACICGSTL